MAARLDISTILNQEIPGSYLIPTASAGVDKHHCRLIACDCRACGSTGTVHRLDKVIRLEISSCGCRKKAAFAARIERRKMGLSQKQKLAIYEAMEKRHGFGQGNESIAEEVAAIFSLDRYVVKAVWREVGDRIQRIMRDNLEVVYADSQRKGATIESLATTWAVPVHAMKRMLHAATALYRVGKDECD